MSWQFWSQSGPKELSPQVTKALSAQLQVDSQGADKLRFLSKSGHYARRRVKLIRIFDPVRIKQDHLAQLKYADFDQAGHHEALMFNGHVEADGSVYLARAS